MYPAEPVAQPFVQSPVPPTVFVEPNRLASRWRRLGAFLIDVIIIGSGAQAVGWLLFTPLSRMGLWAKLFGFCLALPYYVVMNSRMGGGQTYGKRIMSIEVVDKYGNNISPEKSFWRYCLFIIPTVFGGASSTGVPAFLSITLGIALFVVYGGDFFLFFFNRATRQIVHDLAVGTYVVNSSRERIPFMPRKMDPYMFATTATVLVALAGIGFVVLHFVAGLGVYRQLTADLDSVTAIPHVRAVRLNFVTVSGLSGDVERSIQVNVIDDGRVENDQLFADDVEQSLLEKDPSLKNGRSGITVTVTQGYDMGIASNWKSNGFRYSF